MGVCLQILKVERDATGWNADLKPAKNSGEQFRSTAVNSFDLIKLCGDGNFSNPSLTFQRGFGKLNELQNDRLIALAPPDTI